MVGGGLGRFRVPLGNGGKTEHWDHSIQMTFPVPFAIGKPEATVGIDVVCCRQRQAVTMIFQKHPSVTVIEVWML